eukprot:1946531-Prymnesium_polylepis.1
MAPPTSRRARCRIQSTGPCASQACDTLRLSLCPGSLACVCALGACVAAHGNPFQSNVSMMPQTIDTHASIPYRSATPALICTIGMHECHLHTSMKASRWRMLRAVGYAGRPCGISGCLKVAKLREAGVRCGEVSKLAN